LKTKFAVLLFFILLMAGCAQNIRYHDMDARPKTPSISYEAYFYMEGLGEKSRAVFLKFPDAQVDVVASAQAITSTTSTLSEAYSFMNEVRGLRKVTALYLTYKDKPLGYLIKYTDDHDATRGRDAIIIDLYESGGKIRFNAREKLDQSN
jgi:hypothetical protein